MIEFPPFRIDIEEERLWRGAKTVDLRPKAWQLLRYMAERPGLLMTRDELLDAVWGEVTVSVASLNQAVLELRRALQDDARNPRFIKTVHGRGFRFIAVAKGPNAATGEHLTPSSSSGALSVPDTRQIHGRDSEFQQLEMFMEETRAGRRQMVFITGEPGIGKTTLVRAFLESLSDPVLGKPVFVGGGQCLEHVGEAEAYLPVLEGLDRIARDPQGESLRRILRQFAPTWLVQLPWLLDDQDRMDVTNVGGTPARMLREFCVAIEALAEERPVVLWVEDLHWSDEATIDLLGALARRPHEARILVVATYRPVDAAMAEHPVAPLARALVQQRACHELALELLDVRWVAEHLRSRFGDLEQHEELAELIHFQTDGNPLFVETLAQHMVLKGWLARSGEGWTVTVPFHVIHTQIPESLRAIVDGWLDRMTAQEASALEAASVVGETFAAQSIAAALDLKVEDAENLCDRIANWRYFLVRTGSATGAKGSHSQHYKFVHQVFPKILRQRFAPAGLRRLHQRVAQNLESAKSPQNVGLNAEIAFHYEQGGNLDRAIHFLVLAAQGVHRRFANREAVTYLEHALELITGLPFTEERARREIELRLFLASALVPTAGFAAVQQPANTTRALGLARRLGDVESELLSLGYQMNWNMARGNLKQVQVIAEETKKLTATVNNPILQAHPHAMTGIEATLTGEFERAESAFAHCLEFLDDVDPSQTAAVFPLDFGILALSFSGWAAWLCGRPVTARARTRAAQERATTQGRPFGIAVSLMVSMAVEFFLRDPKHAEDLRDELTSCVEQFGIHFPYAMAPAAEGWLLLQNGATEEAIERLHRGIADVEKSESRVTMSLLLATLADAELARGAIAEGLAALDEADAFIDNSGERFWEAEIHRLRGELLRLDGDETAAEECLQRALDVARRQGSRSLELRSAVGLASAWHQSGREAEARSLLSPLSDEFTEGLDTADLRQVATLLTTLD